MIVDSTMCLVCVCVYDILDSGDVKLGYFFFCFFAIWPNFEKFITSPR